MFEGADRVWLAHKGAARIHFELVPFRLAGEPGRAQDLQPAGTIGAANDGRVHDRGHLDLFTPGDGGSVADEVGELDFHRLGEAFSSSSSAFMSELA